MAKNAKGIETVVVINPEIAKLIDEGSRLKRQSDKVDNRLAEIKAELTELNVAASTKHVTAKKNSVTVSATAKFTDISPIAARKKLTEKRLGPKFPSVVSVKLGELKKFLSEDEIDGLRKKVGTTRSYKFA